jgi:hypothetical protein
MPSLMFDLSLCKLSFLYSSVRHIVQHHARTSVGSHEIITPWININHCSLDAGLHDEDIGVGHNRLYNLKGLQANYTLWALYIKYFFYL